MDEVEQGMQANSTFDDRNGEYEEGHEGWSTVGSSQPVVAASDGFGTKPEGEVSAGCPDQ